MVRDSIMSTQNQLLASAAIAATLALLGCNNKDSNLVLPEVNETNCAPENTARILDKEARNKFIDLCVRRNNFKPSKPRGW